MTQLSAQPISWLWKSKAVESDKQAYPWQTPLNSEAKKQLSKLFSETEFNNIFKGKDHEQSK